MGRKGISHPRRQAKGPGLNAYRRRRKPSTLAKAYGSIPQVFRDHWKKERHGENPGYESLGITHNPNKHSISGAKPPKVEWIPKDKMAEYIANLKKEEEAKGDLVFPKVSWPFNTPEKTVPAKSKAFEEIEKSYHEPQVVALRQVRKHKPLRELENTLLRKAIQKYGEDRKRIAMDTQLNRYQLTPTEVGRLLERYKLEKSLLDLEETFPFVEKAERRLKAEDDRRKWARGKHKKRLKS